MTRFQHLFPAQAAPVEHLVMVRAQRTAILRSMRAALPSRNDVRHVHSVLPSADRAAMGQRQPCLATPAMPFFMARRANNHGFAMCACIAALGTKALFGITRQEHHNSATAFAGFSDAARQLAAKISVTTQRTETLDRCLRGFSLKHLVTILTDLFAQDRPRADAFTGHRTILSAFFSIRRKGLLAILTGQGDRFGIVRSARGLIARSRAICPRFRLPTVKQRAAVQTRQISPRFSLRLMEKEALFAGHRTEALLPVTRQNEHGRVTTFTRFLDALREEAFVRHVPVPLDARYGKCHKLSMMEAL